MKYLILLTLLALPTAAVAVDPQYGLTEDHAVEVCDIGGQKAYLEQLICPDGSHPMYTRLGSGKIRSSPPDHPGKSLPGGLMDMLMKDSIHTPPNGHIADAYQVKCGNRATTVFLDMYHCEVPRAYSPPNGFNLIVDPGALIRQNAAENRKLSKDDTAKVGRALHCAMVFRFDGPAQHSLYDVFMADRAMNRLLAYPLLLGMPITEAGKLMRAAEARIERSIKSRDKAKVRAQLANEFASCKKEFIETKAEIIWDWKLKGEKEPF